MNKKYFLIKNEPKPEQYEKNNNLEEAIDEMSRVLIKSPENEQLNKALKSTLRKRRCRKTPEDDTYNISDTLDQLDVNNEFISKAIADNKKEEASNA